MSAIRSSFSPSAARGSDRPIPPLATGDRLTRSEYRARYDAMPENIKAERIEGTVYMPASAVSADFHGVPHANLLAWLSVYTASTAGVRGAANSTIALDDDNDPQPDACIYVLPSYGGRIRKDAKGYIEGAPELVAEIAASSVSIDLGAKLGAYRRNGVREYLVHRTYDGEFDWFILRDGEYHRQTPDANGMLRSAVFPGLWLHPAALIDGRLAEVLAGLQVGLASEEHTGFVAQLVGKQNESK